MLYFLVCVWVCAFCGGGGGDFILCFHSFTSLLRDVFSADFFWRFTLFQLFVFFFFTCLLFSLLLLLLLKMCGRA